MPNPLHKQRLAFFWAGFLTLLVGGPWLAPGYLFGTDWPGPRHFDFPTQLSSSAPLQVLLAAISSVVGGEITGKLFILGILFAIAVLAYLSVPVEGFVPRAAAATVYLLNPFVFGRLHYGQLYLLAGYALLPWVVTNLRRVLESPGPKAGILLALSLAMVGAATTHLLLACAVLCSVMVLAYLVAANRRIGYLKSTGRSLLIAIAAALVLTSYWLVPFMLGMGYDAVTVSGITPSDLQAYAAVPDSTLGLVPNLLGLYGFWAENTGRFTSMKAFVPMWPAVLAMVLVIGAVGAASVFRSRSKTVAAWAAGLIVAALVALVLEMGVSSPLTSGWVRWLDSAFPVYRGMRDAGKWAAVLALVYSQLFAVGVAVMLERLRGAEGRATRNDWAGGVVVGLVLALPLYYGNGLLFGMHGEIQPSAYPAGWYTAERVVLSDSHRGRTLFLPWHEYMTYSFVRNQNAVIACPAPSFFSTAMLVNSNPELPGGAPPTDPDQVAIAALVAAGGQGQWSSVLAAHGIKYVMVARQVDWKSYSYLSGEPGLTLVGDYGTMLLYRNSLVA